MRVLDWLKRLGSPWPTQGPWLQLHGRPVIVFFDPANEVPSPRTRRFLRMVGHWDGSRLTLTSASPPFSILPDGAVQRVIMPIAGPATLKLLSRVLPATYYEGIEFVVYLRVARVPEAAWPLPGREAALPP